MKQAFHTKPDPDEPFRYVCPTCEGQVYRYRTNTGIYCRECNTKYEHKRELVDQKHD